MRNTLLFLLVYFGTCFSDSPIWQYDEGFPVLGCNNQPCLTIDDLFESKNGVNKFIVQFVDSKTYQVLNIKDGSVAATLKLPELKNDQFRMSLKFLNGYTGSGWAVLIGDAQDAVNKAENGFFTVVDENASVLLTGFGYEFKMLFDGTTSYVVANASGQGDSKNHWNVYKLKDGISVGMESGIPKKAIFKSAIGNESFLTNGKYTGTQSGSQIIFSR